MTDDELRELVRAAVARHIGGAPHPAPPAEPAPPVLSLSFSQYRLERSADDTMCLIEPVVRCNHCGFCKCHGH